MTLYIKDIFDKNFIENYLQRVLMLKIYSLLRKKNLQYFNSYLKKRYSLSVEDVLSLLKFSVNKCNGYYIISIDNNIIDYKSNEKVITLVKLLEFGALDIKGLNVVRPAMIYVQSHIKEIYISYMMKGG